MGASLVAIPLAALVLPIALILAAVAIDIVALIWAAYRLWHDEFSIKVWQYASHHFVLPLRSFSPRHR
jgi:hypothetical protein